MVADKTATSTMIIVDHPCGTHFGMNKYTAIGLWCAATLLFLIAVSFGSVGDFIEILNAGILATTVLLAVGYWNFIWYVLIKPDYYGKDALFGLSIIALWFGIVVFRVFYMLNAIHYGHVNYYHGDSAREKILLYGQMIVMLAGYLQYHAAEMITDIKGLFGRIATRVGALAVFIGVEVLQILS
jgi:hypothetical protein